MKKLNITAIILTYNEEKHLQRCIDSVKNIVSDICVIDSHSTDKTKEIAINNGARYFLKEFITYADKFNWALKNCNIDSEWIWRIDADEYISEPLKVEVTNLLPSLSSSITGVYVNRKIVFLGRPLLHGGWNPSWQLKLFKFGYGYCENRGLDEHILLKEGDFIKIKKDQIDENLIDLNSWTQKHNSYSERELREQLISMYGLFKEDDSVNPLLFGSSTERKRWLKNKYSNLPLFIRPFLLFFFKYFIQLGFLDGKSGLVWHVLQGFWYRFLVDAKIYELQKKFKGNKNEIINFINSEYKT